MDVVQLTLEACALVFTPLPLILLFCGVLFGTLLGALPGLGSILALTVCLPFTLMLDHIPAFALMLGTYVGSLYGGSIASSLSMFPGHRRRRLPIWTAIPWRLRARPLKRWAG